MGLEKTRATAGAAHVDLLGNYPFIRIYVDHRSLPCSEISLCHHIIKILFIWTIFLNHCPSVWLLVLLFLFSHISNKTFLVLMKINGRKCI